MRHLTFFVPILLTLTACPHFITPLPAPIEVSGTYRHPASGLEFPESVGDYHRAQMTRFDREGLDVGIGYNHEEPDALVAFTVYVRRPIVLDDGRVATLDRQFDVERDVIHEHHPGATEATHREVKITDGNRTLPGHAAEFHYVDDFSYAKREVVSFLYLFDRDGWIVKYRITFAAIQRFSAEHFVEEFLKIAPWGACAARP
jgi:hypothetical protein